MLVMKVHFSYKENDDKDKHACDEYIFDAEWSITDFFFN